MYRGIFQEERGEKLKYLSSIVIIAVSLRAEAFSSKTDPRYNTSVHNSNDMDSREFNHKIKKIESKTRDLCKEERCEIWKILTDPKNPEFWKEGNHVPDQGWVTMVQDMTVDSAKLFLLRGEIKALYLSQAMSLIDKAQVDLISAGLMRDRYNVISNKSSQLKAKTSQKVDKMEFKDLQYFFLFSPECPFCSMLGKTLIGFPNVYPLQATPGKLYDFPGLEKTDKATDETLSGYVEDGKVPVLVVHHPETKKVVVLKGNQSVEEIVQASAQLLRSH